jgi:outer membrane receptor protein involved in Fe transport
VYWFEPQRRDFASLRWRGSAGNAAWDSIEAQAGQQVIEDGRRNRDLGSLDEDRERNVDTSRGLSFAAVKGLGDVHHITYGADLYTDDVESSRVRTNIVTGATSERAPRFPDGATMLQAGVFIADDWDAHADLDVLAGVRWSYSRTELPRSGTFAPTEVSDAGLTGNLGMSYRAAESVRLVANVGQGFRAPNVFDLGTFGDRPGNRFNIPNPHLEPERVTTVDAGVKFDDGRFAGELIAYHTAYRDKITSVLTGDVTSSGRLVVQSQNAASLTLQGLEFVLRQRLADTLEWHMQLTWTRGEERLDGDEYPADRIPPLNGSAGIAWTPTPRWSLAAWANFADAQDRYSPRDEIDPRIRPGSTPGWSTWNVRAGWQASEHLYTSLQAGNLGDRRYREYGSGLDAAGRGVVLTLEWAW